MTFMVIQKYVNLSRLMVTVEVLLRKSKTTECDAADRKLSSLTEL
jgi:hypothetical protein